MNTTKTSVLDRHGEMHSHLRRLIEFSSPRSEQPSVSNAERFTVAAAIEASADHKRRDRP